MTLFELYTGYKVPEPKWLFGVVFVLGWSFYGFMLDQLRRRGNSAWLREWAWIRRTERDE